jgi:hypothetical protein
MCRGLKRLGKICTGSRYEQIGGGGQFEKTMRKESFWVMIVRMLGDTGVLAIAAKENPFVWRTFAEGLVALSEEGAVATLYWQLGIYLNNYRSRAHGVQALLGSGAAVPWEWALSASASAGATSIPSKLPSKRLH